MHAGNVGDGVVENAVDTRTAILTRFSQCRLMADLDGSVTNELMQ